MDERKAKDLIKDTFEKNYDRSRFTKFVIELFQLDMAVESTRRKYSTQAQFKEKFKPYIDSFERITKYTDRCNCCLLE